MLRVYQEVGKGYEEVIYRREILNVNKYMNGYIEISNYRIVNKNELFEVGKNQKFK